MVNKIQGILAGTLLIVGAISSGSVRTNAVDLTAFLPVRYLWDAQTGTCWTLIKNFKNSGLNAEECY